MLVLVLVHEHNVHVSGSMYSTCTCTSGNSLVLEHQIVILVRVVSDRLLATTPASEQKLNGIRHYIFVFRRRRRLF